MKCAYPIILEKGRAFGCGQCVNCRINKRREWANRIVLESSLYEDNTFVTLTYDDKYLPSDGCVRKATLQNFIKQLRAYRDYQAEKLDQKAPSIRYFGVGEYGSETLRPHYHIILFNHPNCLRGISRYTKRDAKCCAVCATIRRVWKRGNVYLGQVSLQSASYVAGYVIKGWNKETPIDDLSPEFTLKSNRPGIGHDYAWELASSLLAAGATHVPTSCRREGRLWPLGRYIRDKVSTYAGGLELERVPPNQRVHELSEAIYSDPTILPQNKAYALREALIAPQYYQTKQLEKKLAKKAKERSL